MCFAPAFGDQEESMGKINERCGGIDVGKRFLLCCVLTGAAHEEPRSQTRRFDATVSDLVCLREWLAAASRTRFRGDFQLRYAAYARDHGMTSEQMLAHDKTCCPYALLKPYLLWLSGKWLA